MSWQFGRIDLAKTNYTIRVDWEYLDPVPIERVLSIYRDYCRHKHFASVIPMIPGRLQDPNTDMIGYRDQGRLVAWTMIRRWDEENILSDHFAWDYRNPRLRLGILSLETECAIYQARGYRYMYFESVEPYMLDMQGFELLGPI